MTKAILIECHNRWHPAIFYQSPKPSEYADQYCRHHSLMHHTDGFASVEEANTFMQKNMLSASMLTDIVVVDNLNVHSITTYLPNDNWVVGGLDVA